MTAHRSLILSAVGLLGIGLGGPSAAAHPVPLPPVPLPPARVPETLSPAGGPAQTLAPGVLAQPEWWHGFGSDKIDALVALALAHATDIASAEAALRQAQELAKAAGGAEGPQIDASYEAQRAQVASVLATPLADASIYRYTLHTAQVSLSMPLDIFGGGRAHVRSARAAAEASQWRLVAARATVAANLVQAVIQHAALGAQVDLAGKAIAANQQVLDDTRRRRQLGDLGDGDVAAAELALNTAQGALPPLQRQLEHQRAVIATLTGGAAGGPLPPVPDFDELVLPGEVPESLPADIVAQRPDVRAAEAQVKGAAADLGVAAAARWPAFQLTGSAGGTSDQFSNLLAGPAQFFTLAGTVTQPLFHSGQLLHQKRAAQAALDGARDQYRAVALQAFVDVDDALAELKTDAAALDSAARTADAAERTLGYASRQTQLGAIGTTALAGIRASAAQAESALVQARSARLTDTVALYLASGAAVAR